MFVKLIKLKGASCDHIQGQLHWKTVKKFEGENVFSYGGYVKRFCVKL